MHTYPALVYRELGDVINLLTLTGTGNCEGLFLFTMYREIMPLSLFKENVVTGML